MPTYKVRIRGGGVRGAGTVPDVEDKGDNLYDIIVNRGTIYERQLNEIKSRIHYRIPGHTGDNLDREISILMNGINHLRAITIRELSGSGSEFLLGVFDNLINQARELRRSLSNTRGQGLQTRVRGGAISNSPEDDRQRSRQQLIALFIQGANALDFTRDQIIASNPNLELRIASVQGLIQRLEAMLQNFNDNVGFDRTYYDRINELTDRYRVMLRSFENERPGATHNGLVLPRLNF